jgi:uncharacterized membrane protein
VARIKRRDRYRVPATADELTATNVRSVVDLDRKARETASLTDRIADRIAGFCGSMPFVWIHVLWFGGWMAWNALSPSRERFDPFPFTFLTLIVSLEAIFLSTFILISQNREARISERRNKLDLQVNLLSEQEGTKILSILQRMSSHMGVDISDDPTIEVLKQSTEPSRLVTQIEKADEEDRRSDSDADLLHP